MDVDLDRRGVLRAAGMALLLGPAALVASSAAPRVIEMVARRFVFVPNAMRVRRGEALELRITAPEVPMGFSLPDFGVRADVVPGQVATVSLVPQKAGEFTFLCDVFCGTGHENMNGILTVT